MSKGLASVKTLTAQEIAKKWNLPLATVAKKIAAGVKVEKEHTKSTRQANEIARDHLGERPDYYDKLDKMEKTKIVKEESTTGGISGLGYVSGTPAVGVSNYVNTNAMSYVDWNGNKLDNFVKAHTHLHNTHLGYNAFDPKKVGAHKNFNHHIHEAKLNELGEYDDKGGMSGYEGTSGPIRAVRKDAVKKSINERGKVPADMSGGAERGIYQEGYIGFGQWGNFGNGFQYDRKNTYGKKPKEKPESNEPGTGDTYDKSKQGGRVKFAKKSTDSSVKKEETQIDEISAELVGKVSNARFWQKKAPSKTLTRAVNKKFIESGKKKEEDKKEVKEFWTPFLTPHHKHSARLSKEKANKPDTIMDPGAGGTTKTTNEETKMDTKELINEALDNILEDNLSEMKDNLMLALQEKAMEKLEERKKEIAAQYFAQ